MIWSYSSVQSVSLPQTPHLALAEIFNVSSSHGFTFPKPMEKSRKPFNEETITLIAQSWSVGVTLEGTWRDHLLDPSTHLFSKSLVWHTDYLQQSNSKLHDERICSEGKCVLDFLQWTTNQYSRSPPRYPSRKRPAVKTTFQNSRGSCLRELRLYFTLLFPSSLISVTTLAAWFRQIFFFVVVTYLHILNFRVGVQKIFSFSRINVLPSTWDYVLFKECTNKQTS